MRFGDHEVERTELTEISGEIKRSTPNALLIYDGAKEEWCPKQFVEDNRDGTFSMPTWLAKAKGFV
jgi:hypothetical protein